MEELISYLNQSISDEMMSKEERRTLRDLLAETPLSPDQLTTLQHKVHELAKQRANASNFVFIMEWVRSTTNVLMTATSLSDSSKAYFSPGEECRDAILQQINSAVKSLKICVFTISDDQIARSILLAHQKGIDVKILSDNDKLYDMGSDIGTLSREGIEIRIDNTPNHMHHKFMIADGEHLLTGSYNWTNSAARYNHENVLVSNHAGLVKSFQDEFDKLWQQMEVFEQQKPYHRN